MCRPLRFEGNGAVNNRENSTNSLKSEACACFPNITEKEGFASRPLASLVVEPSIHRFAMRGFWLEYNRTAWLNLRLKRINNGEGGIRTLGTRRHTGFRDRPIQPLWHLSGNSRLKACFLNLKRESDSTVISFRPQVPDNTMTTQFVQTHHCGKLKKADIMKIEDTKPNLLCLQ